MSSFRWTEWFMRDIITTKFWKNQFTVHIFCQFITSPYCIYWCIMEVESIPVENTVSDVPEEDHLRNV
ncbi:hypothetical protein C5C07_13975 [Haloferax sp. Atlit-4N]|nr:hypothetical protein C5C07_13975 [Haloferax sp. Atlit-4N]